MGKKIIINQEKQVLEFLKLGLVLNPVVATRELGLIGSTLAYHVHNLRLQGWDIQTKMKRSKYSGSKYAEYWLAPSWRLLSETEKREALKGRRSFHIRNFKIDDRVKLSDGTKGAITGIYKSNLLVLEDESGKEILTSLTDIVAKLRR
nr:MAG TPA: helix-turn-helix domain protein [Caudoviricetes sp.]